MGEAKNHTKQKTIYWQIRKENKLHSLQSIELVELQDLIEGWLDFEILDPVVSPHVNLIGDDSQDTFISV